MKPSIKSLIYLIFVALGIFSCFVLNYNVVHPCILDNESNLDHWPDNAFLTMFYEVSSYTGYHPDPTLFNFLLTGMIGALLGFFIAYKILKKWKIPSF
jgi:hypothetical protein